MNKRCIATFAATLGCALLISTTVQAEAAPGYAVRVSPSLGDFTFLQPNGAMDVTVFYSCTGTLPVNIGVKVKVLKNGNATDQANALYQQCPASDRPVKFSFVRYAMFQPYRPDSTMRFTTELYQRRTPVTASESSNSRGSAGFSENPGDFPASFGPVDKKAQNEQEICPNAALGDCPA